MTSLLPRSSVRVGTVAIRDGDVGRKIPLDGASPPFSAALHTDGCRWILELRGDLHLYSVVALEVQAQQFLGSPATTVVFRLGYLRSIDEAGVRCLIRLRETLEARGCLVSVTGALPVVRTVMDAVDGKRYGKT